MPTKRFYVSKDASIALRDGVDSLGQGAGDNLVVGYGYWLYRSLLQFDIDFSGMTGISSATMSIFSYSRSGKNNSNWEYGSGMDIKRVSAPWSEGSKGADGIWYSNNSVAWTNQPGVTSGSTPSTADSVRDTATISNTRPSHGQGYTFSITDIVKKWAPTNVTGGGGEANYGVRLQMVNESSVSPDNVEFCSREDNTINGGTSYDAYIDITYTTSLTAPTNDIVAPTEDKIATIVNLSSATTWTSTSKLARPRLQWKYNPSSDSGTQSEWRVKIYSALTAGTTYFDSGWVSDVNHATSSSVDIPENMLAATHMPGGITKTITNATWSSSIATFTTSAAHNLDTGMVVSISGLDPSGYNIQRGTVTYVNSTTFTIALASNPGTLTSGSTGTVSTIWHTGFKGLANGSTPQSYWWTIQTRGSAGTESSESARTEFQVLWGQTRNEYTYTTANYSYVHSIGSTPSGTEVARIFGSVASTGNTPGTWYSSLESAISAISTNTILVVDQRVGVLNNSNVALTSAPAVTSSMTYLPSAVSPDKWATDGASSIVSLVSGGLRRFGTKSARLTVNSTSGFMQAYRKAAGDGVLVVPGTDYTFSAYINVGLLGVTGSADLRIYAGPSGTAALTTSTLVARSDPHTSFNPDSDGWRRLYVSFNSGGNEFVKPVIYCGTHPITSAAWTSGQSIFVDGSIVEEGTVVRSYTPGLVNSPALIEGGGIQVDASEGGTFRLRGSTVGSQNVVQLGSKGLVFGPTSSPQLYSLQDTELSVDGWVRSYGALATDFAFGAAITGDTYSRGMMLADGKIEWGAGGANLRDTNLYRSAANVLKTDDTFNVPSIVMPGSTSGTITITPTAVAGTTTLTLPATTGTVALTSQIPSITGTTLALTGDLTLAATAITIGAANSLSVAVNNDSHTHGSSTISGLALGTDVSGTYVAGITGGTGVSVSGTAGAGWSPTVSIGQAVGTTSNVTFNNVTANGTTSLNGSVTLGNATADVVRVLNIFQTTAITNSFNPRMYNASGATPWRIFYDTSSERFKTNIVYMEDTDAILNVNPVSYHDKVDYEANGEESPRQYGFLAEEMAANPEGIAFVVNNGADAETIQYERLVVPLFSAMRALRARIEELEAKIAELNTGA